MRRDLVISSKLQNIEKVRFFLDTFFSEACLDKKLFNKVFLGLSEAVSNSIVHGNMSDGNRAVSISVSVKDFELVIEVQDQGNGFSFEVTSDPTCKENLLKESGRGIFLIKKMADEIVYFNGGRCVEIKYNLS